MVDDMLQADIIWPSVSWHSSLVLLVKKMDWGWRFCMDSGARSNVTISDKFTILIDEELLDELHWLQIYSKIDSKLGYHQIWVHDEDVEKTTFRTHRDTTCSWACQLAQAMLPYILVSYESDFQTFPT